MNASCATNASCVNCVNCEKSAKPPVLRMAVQGSESAAAVAAAQFSEWNW